MTLQSSADPIAMLDWTVEEMYAMPAAEVEEFRLAAARARFEELRPKVEFLDRLAANQKTDEITTLADIVPVLFQHTVYKSYPLSVLERGQFERLTKWLGQLTAHDVSQLPAKECDTIDGWLEMIDRESDLRVCHTSATGGKLSFVPRSVTELAAFDKAFRHYHMPWTGEQGVDLNGASMPVVAFGYRYGFNSGQRRLDSLVETLAGSEDRCYPLYPGRLSADLLSLAGRLAAAEDRGERGQVEINPALAVRREEFAEVQRMRATYIANFVERIRDEIPGEQVLMSGTWNHFLDAALEAERQGYQNAFSPNSALLIGGGFKGRADVPDDWYDRICSFLGAEQIRDAYGMTESLSMMRKCSHGHYHVPPYQVPFVLDPDDGAPLARTGVVRGRYAFLDLLTQSYWGGFITGDEVTIHWDEQCGCGRTGAFLDGDFERYSVLRGGDDKISCAKIPDAHDAALDHLLEGL